MKIPGVYKMKNVKIKVLSLTATLMLSTLAQAAGSTTPLFKCIDKKNGFKLEVAAISPTVGTQYTYQIKVHSKQDKLIYSSRAITTTIGRETIFALTGGAVDSTGYETASSLYFRVDKVGTKFTYLLEEQSYAPIKLPGVISFNCQ